MSTETGKLRNSIVTGNATIDGDGNSHRGWFIGHFVDPAGSLRSTQDLEIKWGVHATGDEKPSPEVVERATTLALLVSGLFVLEFPELKRLIYLERPGDYVVFAPKMLHTWRALEDSVVLSVRWPSVITSD